MKRLLPFLTLLLLCACAEEASHGDPFAPVFEAFAIILTCALVGRFLANRLKQSTVLGELVVGILVGAVLMGLDRPAMHVVRNQEVVMEMIRHLEKEGVTVAIAVERALTESTLPSDEKEALREIMSSGNPTVYINLVRSTMLLSTLGISLLLFMVGLEGSIHDLFSVGSKAMIIALLGVTVTMGLGYLVLSLLLTSDADPRLAFFGAATICSTSAGITARVLRDMNKLNTAEAKITMGAAVFDDILGLIILAILASVLAGGEVEPIVLGTIVLKIGVFLIAVIFFGVKVLPRIIPVAEKLDPKSIRLLFPFVLMLILCFVANAMGLAMIIGAYFAGLMITDKLFTRESGDGRTKIEALIAPLEGIFVPVFFVLMGLQVDVMLFANMNVIILGLAVSAVAVLGKLGAGIFLPPQFKKIAVGWGMVPRGEVVLIFANLGKGMGIINPEFYAVTVMVILITVLVAPPALQKAYSSVK